MTNRHSGYLVVLDNDVREDNDQNIIEALKMVKGVIAVTPVTSTPSQQIAEMRARNDLRIRVAEFFKQLFEEK